MASSRRVLTDVYSWKLEASTTPLCGGAAGRDSVAVASSRRVLADVYSWKLEASTTPLCGGAAGRDVVAVASSRRVLAGVFFVDAGSVHYPIRGS